MENKPIESHGFVSEGDESMTLEQRVYDMMQYHPWDVEQIKKGDAVRKALTEAVFPAQAGMNRD